MKKGLAILLIILLSMTLMVGCTPSNTEEDPNGDGDTTLDTRPTKDREGNDIEVPENVETIITLSGAATEILVDLGVGDRIVGIEAYSNTVEGLNEGIAELDMMAPNPETITELSPDMIIATPLTKLEGVDPLASFKEQGICVVYIPNSESVAAIQQDIHFIGSLVDKTEEAEAIVKQMNTEIKAIIDKVTEVVTKKTVYMEIAPDPYLTTFGSGVFLDELLTIAGGVNVFADQTSWVGISQEQVVEKNPDVILTNVNYVPDPVGSILARDGWDVITAIQNEAVYAIDADSSSRPSHKIIQALNEMATQIYPEIFN